MAADPSGQDPKALWKELDPETDPVTLDQIHALARKFDRAARQMLVIMPLILVFMAFMLGQQWQMFNDTLRRSAVALTALGMLMSGFLVIKATVLPRAPGEPAGLYLRRRLQQTLTIMPRGWPLAALPLLPGMLLWAYVEYTNNRGPLFLTLLPVALVIAALAFVLRQSSASTPKIRAQLGELDELLERKRSDRI